MQIHPIYLLASTILHSILFVILMLKMPHTKNPIIDKAISIDMATVGELDNIKALVAKSKTLQDPDAAKAIRNTAPQASEATKTEDAQSAKSEVVAPLEPGLKEEVVNSKENVATAQEQNIEIPPAPSDAKTTENVKAIDNKVAENKEMLDNKIAQPSPLKHLDSSKKADSKNQEKTSKNDKSESKKEPKKNKDSAARKNSNASKAKKQSNDIMDDMLRDFSQKSDGLNSNSKKISAKSGQDDKNQEGTSAFSEESSLSISEKTLIKRKIQSKWRIGHIDSKAKQFRGLIYLQLNTDGTIAQFKTVKVECPPDANCQVMIQSMERAVTLAAPFEELDPARYDAWSEFQIEFSPDF